MRCLRQAGSDLLYGHGLQCSWRNRRQDNRLSPRALNSNHYKLPDPLQWQISSTNTMATPMAESNKNFVKVTINSSVNLYNPTKIKNFRKKHNLKRTELSNLTGISINALQLWELGQAKPHYKYWRKLLLFMREYEKENK